MSENTHGSIRLLGRIGVTATLKTLSGLFIGGSDSGPGFGGLDQVVVRDGLSREPYIPGSSLKGKMRALTERVLGVGLREVRGAGDARHQRFLHLCAEAGEYRESEIIEGYRGCPVCHLFGNASRRFPVLPTRLVTRDAYLGDASRRALAARRTDLPFTEVKTETVVDRISSAATPRSRERVPAGTVFDVSWSLACYALEGGDLNDHRLLALLFAGMGLLEDDYLGGQGSRGYGRIAFEEIRTVVVRDRGLAGDALELVESLKEIGTTAAALEATGDPLAGKSS